MRSSKCLTLLMAMALAPAWAGCTKLFRPDPVLEDLTGHPIKQIANWQDELQLPVEERVFAAPPAVLDYMDKDNRFNGFAGEPEAVDLTPALKADVQGAIRALPPGLKAKLAERLIGVFVVKGLGSSAYTDYVRDENKRPRYAFVVLDVEAMSRKANDWMTWKENSPFLSDAANRVEAVIEEPANDTVGRALEYVLIHEFGHVLAFNSDVHPLWSVASGKIDFEDYPFLELSWKADAEGKGYLRLIDEKRQPPGPIIYYKPSDERLPGAAISGYYDWLAASSFVTLYAATNPYDDFAEALVTYVHTVVLKRPFLIRVIRDGKIERTVKACWDEARCAKKREVLEDFVF